MATALPCQRNSTLGDSNISMSPDTLNYIAYHRFKTNLPPYIGHLYYDTHNNTVAGILSNKKLSFSLRLILVT